MLWPCQNPGVLLLVAVFWRRDIVIGASNFQHFGACTSRRALDADHIPCLATPQIFCIMLVAANDSSSSPMCQQFLLRIFRAI